MHVYMYINMKEIYKWMDKLLCIIHGLKRYVYIFIEIHKYVNVSACVYVKYKYICVCV